MLCAISEMFRHYVDFDPLDLLIVHAVLNSNVIHIMSNQVLDRRYSSIDAVEPDAIKQGLSGRHSLDFSIFRWKPCGGA
jgi:hypothetical protein